jgi:hypothetical protein
MASESRQIRRRAERKQQREQRKQLHTSQDIPPEAREKIEAAMNRRPRGAAKPKPAAEDGAAAAAAGPSPDISPEIEAQVREALGEGGGDAIKALTAAAPKKARAKRYVELEAKLALLLIWPAPVAERAGDLFCAEHYAAQGPLLAAALTSWAEGHPAFYALLIQLLQVGSLATLILAVGAYALPPLIHHGLVPAPDALRRHFGLPVEPKPEPEPEPEPVHFRAASSAAA